MGTISIEIKNWEHEQKKSLTKEIATLIKNKDIIYKNYSELQRINTEIAILEKSKESLETEKTNLNLASTEKRHIKSKSVGRTPNRSTYKKKINALRKEEEITLNEITQLDNVPKLSDLINEKDIEIERINEEIANISLKIDELKKEKIFS